MSFSIRGYFRAAKEKRVDIIEVDSREVDPSGDDIEPLVFELLFDPEDFVKGARLFRVSNFEGEC
jgi:hypothetical protein